MPIDHAAAYVTDLERSKAFYEEALKPIGYSLMFEQGEFLGSATRRCRASALCAGTPQAGAISRSRRLTVRPSTRP